MAAEAVGASAAIGITIAGLGILRGAPCLRRRSHRAPWSADPRSALLAGLIACTAIAGAAVADWRGVTADPPPRGTQGMGSAGRWSSRGGTGEHPAGQRAGRGSELAASLRSRAAAAFDVGLPTELEALLKGMALGDDSGLSPSVRRDFRNASLSHVTAASGQNIALLLALAMPILAGFGVRYRWRIAVCALLALVYVPLAGAESPIRRACVMALAALLARGRGGRGRVWHSILLAAVVTAILDPTAPGALGWQLSFAAVVAMVALGPPLSAALERTGLPEPLREPIAMTIAATLSTTPLIAHAAGRLSIAAVPANLIAAPAVAGAMSAGLAAAAVGQISPMLSGPLLWAAALPAGAVLEVASIFGRRPFGAVDWRPDSAITIGMLAVLAAFTGWLRWRTPTWPLTAPTRSGASQRHLRPKGRKLAAALAGVAVLVGGCLVLEPRSGDYSAGPRIAFIDVGQGDAELVADGHAGILIDTGPPSTPIASKLREMGIKRLVGLLLTHGQADHAGALDDLLRGFRPELVIDGTATAAGAETARVASLIRAHGLSAVRPTPGLRIAAGDASIEVIAPTRAGAAGQDPNTLSAVAVARAGPLSALLTGDAESPVLEELDLPSVDVIKLPHHGSTDPGLGSVLERVQPALSVVEVGRNPYGHPARSALAQAQRWGRVLRTDRGGTIVVTGSAANGLRIRSEPDL